MYAIVAGFDPQTEERIKKLWRGLAEEGISDYAARVADRKPHITLATFEKITDNQAFQECLTAWCNSQSPLSFQVTSIGSFLESGALYLAPLVTRSLLDFHQNLHQALLSHVLSVDSSLYAPDVWPPHITLANYLTEKELGQAFLYCKDKELVFGGQIASILLLHFPEEQPVETVAQWFLEQRDEEKIGKEND